MNNDRLSRTELLLGKTGLARLQAVRVIIFGVGGVGSWCAESLVRTGLRHITLVDADTICTSNINRQLHATEPSVGHVKVDAMRQRLLSIDSQIDVTCIHEFYSEETADSFCLDQYDYIIDCIDSLSSKALLISRATRAKGIFLSSMGAALKVDSQRIRLADFWDVQGCPLGSKLRKMLRKQKAEIGHFRCVFSDEVLPNVTSEAAPQGKRINGSLVHITAIFGFMLAGEVVKDIMQGE